MICTRTTDWISLQKKEKKKKKSRIRKGSTIKKDVNVYERIGNN